MNASETSLILGCVTTLVGLLDQPGAGIFIGFGGSCFFLWFLFRSFCHKCKPEK